MESKIADPAVYGETEWISVMFHGQSFMLHQVCHSINQLGHVMADKVFDVQIVGLGNPPSNYLARKRYADSNLVYR